MSNARRPQHRRPRQQQRPAQGHTPYAHHHHVTIDRTNADYWLAHMREAASKARVEDGPEAGDGFDLLADDLAACMAGGWRAANGLPILQWQYHMWVTPHPSGAFETIIELWPEYLAA